MHLQDVDVVGNTAKKVNFYRPSKMRWGWSQEKSAILLEIFVRWIFFFAIKLLATIGHGFIVNIYLFFILLSFWP